MESVKYDSSGHIGVASPVSISSLKNSLLWLTTGRVVGGFTETLNPLTYIFLEQVRPLRREMPVSTVFGGQYVGIREVADQIWLVSFMRYDLGFFDQVENRVEPVGHNPFAPKVLPMCSE